MLLNIYSRLKKQTTFSSNKYHYVKDWSKYKKAKKNKNLNNPVIKLWSKLLTHSLLAATNQNFQAAANLCNQFGPRSGLTECPSSSGSKLFDFLIVPEKYFEKDNFEKS